MHHVQMMTPCCGKTYENDEHGDNDDDDDDSEPYQPENDDSDGDDEDNIEDNINEDDNNDTTRNSDATVVDGTTGVGESARITGVGDDVPCFNGPDNGGGGENKMEIVFESDHGSSADSDAEVPDLLGQIAEAHEADGTESSNREGAQDAGAEPPLEQLAADMDRQYGA